MRLRNQCHLMSEARGVDIVLERFFSYELLASWFSSHSLENKQPIYTKNKYGLNVFSKLDTDLQDQGLYGTDICICFSALAFCPRQESEYNTVIRYQCVHVKSLQLCPNVCDLMDSSPLGFSVHGILQARTLEWVAMPSSRGSS